MAELLSAAEMRAAEDAAIGSGAVTGLELMERAGQGVVTAALRHWHGLTDLRGRAVVLCGPGNNGGDGFVVARRLAQRGWSVGLWLLGAPEKLPPDAAANCARWTGMGSVHPMPVKPDLSEHPCAGADLVVDAVFGTGLARPLEVSLQRLMDGAARVVSVDVPSGLCADSGRVLGDAAGRAVRADLTVTFHRAKPGHYLADGPSHCGRLVVCDIGLPE